MYVILFKFFDFLVGISEYFLEIEMLGEKQDSFVLPYAWHAKNRQGSTLYEDSCYLCLLKVTKTSQQIGHVVMFYIFIMFNGILT